MRIQDVHCFVSYLTPHPKHLGVEFVKSYPCKLRATSQAGGYVRVRPANLYLLQVKVAPHRWPPTVQHNYIVSQAPPTNFSLINVCQNHRLCLVLPCVDFRSFALLCIALYRRVVMHYYAFPNIAMHHPALPCIALHCCAVIGQF